MVRKVSKFTTSLIFILSMSNCEKDTSPNFEYDYDCNGTIDGSAEEDCNSVCLGTAAYDDCSICTGGNTGLTPNYSVDYFYCHDSCIELTHPDVCGKCGGEIEELIDCLPPEPLHFSISTLSSYYLFQNVLINDTSVDKYDWVAVFNNETCIGARIWNTGECGSEICDVPAMGNDGSSWTVGYITSGVMPSFKIFDSSEGILYDALPDTNYVWNNFAFHNIDTLKAVIP